MGWDTLFESATQTQFRTESTALNTAYFELWQRATALAARDSANRRLADDVNGVYRRYSLWFNSDDVTSSRTDRVYWRPTLMGHAEQLVEWSRLYDGLYARVEAATEDSDREPLMTGRSSPPAPSLLPRAQQTTAANRGKTNLVWWLLGGALVVGGGYYAYRTLRRKATDKILGE